MVTLGKSQSLSIFVARLPAGGEGVGGDDALARNRLEDHALAGMALALGPFHLEVEAAAGPQSP